MVNPHRLTRGAFYNPNHFQFSYVRLHNERGPRWISGCARAQASPSPIGAAVPRLGRYPTLRGRPYSSKGQSRTKPWSPPVLLRHPVNEESHFLHHLQPLFIAESAIKTVHPPDQFPTHCLLGHLTTLAITVAPTWPGTHFPPTMHSTRPSTNLTGQ